MIPDRLAALIDYLTEHPDIDALVDGRVYGRTIPREDTNSMPRKCITLSLVAGSPGRFTLLKVSSSRMDVRCYGETDTEAMAVHLAVFEVLKNLERLAHGDTLIHRASPEIGMFPHQDPDIPEWPVVFSSWELLAAEVAIA